jgi:pimeloyl-ACP methyl ester carboxylesterase
MARLAGSLLAVLVFTTAGCGQSPRDAAALPEPPKFANEWLMSASATADDSGTSLNIHETSIGLAGRLALKDGAAFPIHNILRTEESLSFMVPAINATYAGVKTAGGEWAGDWTDDKGKRAIAFGRGGPPAGAEKWVVLNDGRQMYLDCRGAGGPVVVFDAGAGGGSKDWQDVHEAVAKTTKACAYDRASHGLSDPGSLPRDTAAVANDLDEMLDVAGIAGPYVLVGHSLGSYHVRHFANTRFEETAGMVLVDPSGDGQMARFTTVIPKIETIVGATREKQKSLNCVASMRAKLVRSDDPLASDCFGNDANVIEGNLSEVESMVGASTEQLLESRRSYGDMPLIVLTRSDYVQGMPPEFTDQDRTAMAKIWTEMHEEMTTLSTAGERRVIPTSGHYIQRDQPQAVIDAINEVVAKARARQGAAGAK